MTQALRHAGFNLDPPVVQAMMNRHDPDNNNQMSLDEFIRMCLFLQSCVRTFSAFDAQRTGRITLDFGQVSRLGAVSKTTSRFTAVMVVGGVACSSSTQILHNAWLV